MEKERQSQVAIIKALPGVGHVTAALIYMTMGLLAGLLAIGARGHTPDVRGTIRALREQPFGPLVLLLVACGSIALLVWRLLQAFADLESKGSGFVGIIQRSRYFFSGVFYAGMPILIWKMFNGAPVHSSDHWARKLASTVIALPFGWTLLVGTGLGFFVYSSVCLYRLVRGNFHAWFNCEQMTPRQQSVLFALGRVGYAARGLIALAIGYFVLLGGWHVNASEVAGQAGALNRVVHQPLGPLALGAIAIGLICLGLFSLGTARFGKLPVDRVNELLQWCGQRLKGTRFDGLRFPKVSRP